MDQLTMAYLLGPAVMLAIAVLLWAAAHHKVDHDSKPRRARWLDTHPTNWMRHRH